MQSTRACKHTPQAQRIVSLPSPSGSLWPLLARFKHVFYYLFIVYERLTSSRSSLEPWRRKCSEASGLALGRSMTPAMTNHSTTTTTKTRTVRRCTGGARYAQGGRCRLGVCTQRHALAGAGGEPGRRRAEICSGRARRRLVFLGAKVFEKNEFFARKKFRSYKQQLRRPRARRRSPARRGRSSFPRPPTTLISAATSLTALKRRPFSPLVNGPGCKAQEGRLPRCRKLLFRASSILPAAWRRQRRSAASPSRSQSQRGTYHQQHEENNKKEMKE